MTAASYSAGALAVLFVVIAAAACEVAQADRLGLSLSAYIRHAVTRQVEKD